MDELQPTPPYAVGLALSGGGARGFAHIGAIKALEEAAIHPDVISGVSAGSLVGVLYADGYSSEEMLELFAQIGFSDFAQLCIPRTGFFKIDGFRQFLQKTIRAKRLEDLKTPLHVTATNLDRGESVTFTEGNIVDIVTASCSVPVLFPPVEIAGEHYVDGGVFRNFPVTPIRPLCETVIGINVSPIVSNDYKQNIRDIAVRSYNYLIKSNTVADMALCDILVETDEAEQFHLFELDKLQPIIAYGYKDTQLALSIAAQQHRLKT